MNLAMLIDVRARITILYYRSWAIELLEPIVMQSASGGKQ